MVDAAVLLRQAPPEEAAQIRVQLLCSAVSGLLWPRADHRSHSSNKDMRASVQCEHSINLPFSHVNACASFRLEESSSSSSSSNNNNRENCGSRFFHAITDCLPPFVGCLLPLSPSGRLERASQVLNAKLMSSDVPNHSVGISATGKSLSP